MKTSTSLFLALGSLALLVAGCSAETNDSDSIGEADESPVSTGPATAGGMQLAPATLLLSGERLFSYYEYEDGLTVQGNVAGLPAGAVLEGQTINVENPGDAHEFGVYDGQGRKVGTFDAKKGASSLRIRKVGQYALTCEDCLGLSTEGKEAKTWEAFIDVLNAGKAFSPVRPTVSMRVIAQRDLNK